MAKYGVGKGGIRKGEGESGNREMFVSLGLGGAALFLCIILLCAQKLGLRHS